MDSFLSQEQCDDVPYIPSYQDWTEYSAWLHAVESKDGVDDRYLNEDCDIDDRGDEDNYDGQPDEYTEWQDYFGGDDWDHGQYDND